MAQKVTVELQDDLDGGPADETVRFGVDGAEYEIDLSKKNAAALRRKLAPFIEHSRKAGRGQRRRGGRTASSRDRSGSIRAWAQAQGITVSARGRIPASVVEQYQAATQRALTHPLSTAGPDRFLPGRPLPPAAASGTRLGACSARTAASERPHMHENSA
jgi:hypothetical protein